MPKPFMYCDFIFSKFYVLLHISLYYTCVILYYMSSIWLHHSFSYTFIYYHWRCPFFLIFWLKVALTNNNNKVILVN